MLQPAPFSTGYHPRRCRVCGASFVGLGTLCPIHLAQQARARAIAIKYERERSNQIIAAREQLAIAARPQRTEIPDELDLDCFGPQPVENDYRIANRPDNPNWHGMAAWFDEIANRNAPARTELPDELDA